MSVADNEKRIDRLERDAQRKDVCEPIRKRLEGRIAEMERQVDGMRQRMTGILVAVILSLIGITINLVVVLAKS